MPSKKQIISIHFPSDLHTKLKSHAHTEMRSFQKQVLYILEAYVIEKKLTAAHVDIPVGTDDLEFVDE